MKIRKFEREENFCKNGKGIQFSKTVILVLMMMVFSKQGFGQRTIVGNETWFGNGTIISGFGSFGSTPNYTAGVFNCNFDITIMPGSSLTLNSAIVYMGAVTPRRITVQCNNFFGALLQIKGSTISRIGATGLWNGITVEGNENVPQAQVISSITGTMVWTQGCVDINEQSEISFALDGIRLWDGTYVNNNINNPNSSKNGGIVFV